ncbi:O-antigen ligase family protein [Nocardioides sp. SR21]|uniref:O-antigen ligase family protein n=1 Tax=Nocardioides sp. SR21 TaxID=2919501 RepID=UPI001FAA213B|nr:O-antigen ligase family protein [Nocardioides sp. SR21]
MPGIDQDRDRRVVRQSAVSGVMAMVAVGSGLLLDVVAAAIFGAGRETDAFVVAARIPLGLVAILMVLGNQVLVATFATWSLTVDERRARRLLTTVLVGAVAAGAVLAGLLSLAAPYLVVALGPGFDAGQHELAAELMQVMVWVIPLVAGCEVLRAWLNSLHYFAIPAAMTVVLNVVAVGVVLAGPREIRMLPIAYVAGAVVQIVLMLGYASARGLRLGRPVLRDAEVGVLARLLVRPSAAAAMNPLTRAAETFAASFLPPGSATIVHYGQRAVSAVGGTVLFRSVMIAVLPRLTRAFVAADQAAVARLERLAMRQMVVVSFPLTTLTLVLAVPAAEQVFGIGRFGDDARTLGLVLTVLALSFPLSAAQRALLAPFYAVRNTRVPLYNTLVGAVANLALLPVFLWVLDGRDDAVLGIAAAYVGANAANLLHAWWAARRSDLGVPAAGRAVVVRSTCSALLAALAAALVWSELPAPAPVRLVAAGAAGLATVLVVELPGRVPRPAVTRWRSGAPGVALLALVAGAAATASSLAFVQERGMLLTILPIGLLAATALLSLALARFEVFVLAVLVTRTSLDALQSGSPSAALEPASLLGMLFMGTGLLWLAAQWREDGVVRLSRLGWAVTAFAGAALLGVLVAPSYWPALVEWVRLSSVCVMVLVAERLARHPDFRGRVVVALGAAAVVPLTVGAWQLWSGSGLFDAGGFARVQGTFTHSNPMAAFLAILVVMAFAHVAHLRDVPLRWVAGAVGLVATVGLYVTYTRAAWLAALLGVAIVAATRGRAWVIGLAAAVLVSLLMIPGTAARFADLGDEQSSRGEPSNSLTWRVGYWGESVALSEESPVTGIGLKQVVAQSTEGKQPHNDFLRAYVELGVLGIAAFAWLMWQFLATGRRAVRATRDGPPAAYAFAVGFLGVAAGYLLMSLVANLMSQVVVGIYFAALAGVASYLAERGPEPVPEPEPADRALEEVND